MGLSWVSWGTVLGAVLVGGLTVMTGMIANWVPPPERVRRFLEQPSRAYPLLAALVVVGAIGGTVIDARSNSDKGDQGSSASPVAPTAYVTPSTSASSPPASSPAVSSPSVNINPVGDSPDAERCQSASGPGSLKIPDGGEIGGGPNYVPAGCSVIYLQLTAVDFVTRARACTEDEAADGTVQTARCGPVVRLQDGGAWNVLLDDVEPGTRWKLVMDADGAETVRFLFSG